MATRIQTVAAPDTIAVDENTMRLVGRAFHCADLGKFELHWLLRPLSDFDRSTALDA
jgi:class 3 adenylate cyclase